MLWAKRTLAAGSLYSAIEKGRTSKVIRGRAMINPARSGLFPDNQEAKAMTDPEISALNKNSMAAVKHKAAAPASVALGQCLNRRAYHFGMFFK